jgi:hypothetical protein
MNRWGQIPLHDPWTGKDRRVRPLFIGFIGATMLVGAAILLTERRTTEIQPSTDTIRTAFESIPPPPGARAEHNAEFRSKWGAISVSNRYMVESDTTSLFQYFHSELTAHGWKYHGNFSGGNHVGQDYCNGGLLASVEVIPDKTNSGISFVLSITWSGVSKRECL